MNHPDLRPFALQLSCLTCSKDGDDRFIIVNNDRDLGAPILLQCTICSKLTAYTWCEPCGYGANVVGDLSQKPKNWFCPDCNRKSFFSSDFYHTKPQPLMKLSELPADLIPDLFKSHLKKT